MKQIVEVKWFFIKFFITDLLELEYEEKTQEIIKEILSEVEVPYKLITKQMVVIAIENKPNQEQLKNLEGLFKEKITAIYYDLFDNIETSCEDSIIGVNIPQEIELEEHDIDVLKEQFKLEDISFERELNSSVRNFKYKEQETKFNIVDFDQCVKKIVKSKFLYELEDITLEYFEKEEVLFSFSILGEASLDEKYFINFIQSNREFIQVEDETEQYYLEEIDYNGQRYSDSFFIHNIRKKNIALCQKKSSGTGLIIIGYMNLFPKEMKITIKAFDYSLLKNIIDFIRKRYKNIRFESNVEWQWLMSRQSGNGYREADRHILNSELAKKFLNTTKSSDLSKKLEYVLDKILNKGYLSKEEYFGRENSINSLSKIKKISKFLHKYTKIESQQLVKNSFWLEHSTGIFYKESSNKAQPNRITECSDAKEIYAPQNNLIYYIRAYWHQRFVEEMISKIQTDWRAEKYDFQIVKIASDKQFDLINEMPEKSTRDIDTLILIRQNSPHKDYIIGIEAKRNANEFESVKRDTVNKISLKFAPIFAGFIMISYFDNIRVKPLIEKQRVIWSKVDEENIVKPLLLCADSNFSECVSKIKDSILIICKSVKSEKNNE